MGVLTIDLIIGTTLLATTSTGPWIREIWRRSKYWRIFSFLNIMINGNNFINVSKSKYILGYIYNVIIVELAFILILLIFITPERRFIAFSLAIPLWIISILDLRWFWIPDRISLPILFCGLIYAWGHDTFETSAIGALLGFGLFFGIRIFYRYARGISGLGLGDIKFAAAMGAWLGVGELVAAIVLSGLLAICGHILFTLSLDKQISMSGRIPFGTYMSITLWLLLFFGRNTMEFLGLNLLL